MGVRGRYSSRRFGRHIKVIAITFFFVLLWTFREQLRLDRYGLDSSIVSWIPRPPQDIFDFEPLNSDVIRAVCSATEWDAKSKMQVVFTCDNNVGGIANIRNSILNCVRYTMLAGGSLVLPRIFVPSESDTSAIGTGRRQNLGYMFDRDHFVESLRLSCPQLRLFNNTDEVFERIGRPRTWSLGLFPESLVEEENIPSTGIEHPDKWKSLLYEWLDTIDENIDVAPAGQPPNGPMLVDLGRSYLTYPIDHDGEVFATTFGNVLKFRADVRELATATILGIDRHFFGAHLRTGGEEADDGLARWAPSDPMWQWTEYAKQTDAYFDQAGRWDLSVMYVGGGNETQVAVMEADAEPRGVTVVTKRDLLVGENRKRLDALGREHQEMIDFLVMLGAAQFGGVGYSSFAWNVALKRHIFSVEKERFLEGPQMLSDELSQTRRERGVLAQREYRKRHASKVQKLQDENKKLKDIIGDINKALERQGDLSEDLRAALSKARDLAGIGSSISTEDEASTSNESSSGQQTEPLDPAIEEIIRLDPTIAGELVPTGRLSPRLDYGLWIDPDRIIRILEPPVDIVPYLGSGMNTLAGCIFWSTMNYTIDLWNSRSTPLSTKYLDRMFNHSKHLTDRQFLLSLAQARVDYKEKGFMYKKLSEQFERNAMNELYQRIKAEYEMRGQPSRWWKRPEEVADTVLSMLGDALRDRFQAVIDGHGTKEDAELLRPLVTWLAQNFICFGDGPRWSSVFVSVAVGSWLNEMKRRESLEA
ncbi:hypothetical protein CkaCkLH20_06009 [Colletotrichum karsti]|uniref:Alternative oxidase n=1 Tax=Colletotrichum karsti TaxID=1095194 RepID=A0A9P6LKW5_9PEZI|nr:uncharacterized protein CkaCkLH20_06009 [Colletotrichum karsti]KAF9876601.1 hypothetical protein CkaCkLH20_06009 [Colletotrichum karsti]